MSQRAFDKRSGRSIAVSRQRGATTADPRCSGGLQHPAAGGGFALDDVTDSAVTPSELWRWMFLDNSQPSLSKPVSTGDRRPGASAAASGVAPRRLRIRRRSAMR